MTNINHNLVMFVIMIIAGFLSTMNVWADSWDDVRFHLNDLYMVLLMVGWMFLFMGLYYYNLIQLIIGLCLVIVMLVAIRNQLLISQDQFIRGMIPHHSMAVFMSKRLLAKLNTITPDVKKFVQNIIETQEQEICDMKKMY